MAYSDKVLDHYEMAYSDKVLDHYENPRNVGAFDKGDETIGTGMVGAPACGDVMKLQIKVGADGLIEDAKFKTYGCGSAIASSSLVTEWVKGKTLDQALAIKNTQIAEELALPPVKIHCSILAEDAIKAAVLDDRRCEIQDLRLRFGHRVELPGDGMGQGQDPGPGTGHQEHADRRRTGPAASEDPLLHPGGRRHQGGGTGLPDPSSGSVRAPEKTPMAALHCLVVLVVLPAAMRLALNVFQAL